MSDDRRMSFYALPKHNTAAVWRCSKHGQMHMAVLQHVTTRRMQS